MIEWELRKDITKRAPFLLGIAQIISPPARNLDNFSQEETVFFLKRSEYDRFCSSNWQWFIDSVI